VGCQKEGKVQGGKLLRQKEKLKGKKDRQRGEGWAAEEVLCQMEKLRIGITYMRETQTGKITHRKRGRGEKEPDGWVMLMSGKG